LSHLTTSVGCIDIRFLHSYANRWLDEIHIANAVPHYVRLIASNPKRPARQITAHHPPDRTRVFVSVIASA